MSPLGSAREQDVSKTYPSHVSKSFLSYDKEILINNKCFYNTSTLSKNVIFLVSQRKAFLALSGPYCCCLKLLSILPAISHSCRRISVSESQFITLSAKSTPIYSASKSTTSSSTTTTIKES